MCAICEFKIEFSIGHPLALSVAVATRKAIEAGLVDEIETDDGALSAARKRGQPMKWALNGAVLRRIAVASTSRAGPQPQPKPRKIRAIFRARSKHSSDRGSRIGAGEHPREGRRRRLRRIDHEQ
jgi:hypothetical protein